MSVSIVYKYCFKVKLAYNVFSFDKHNLQKKIKRKPQHLLRRITSHVQYIHILILIQIFQLTVIILHYVLYRQHAKCSFY